MKAFQNGLAKPLDPFSIKSLPKWHPYRALITLSFRYQEWLAAVKFHTYQLPRVSPQILQPGHECNPARNTAVSAEQFVVLSQCLAETESLPFPCVEIGSYRGVTTTFMASHTKRKVIAIDPFIGWGGCDEDMRICLANTRPHQNVCHIRMTSGSAAAEIAQASFVFIDAVHDYANVRHDLAVYSRKIVSLGIVALHDTDNPSFAGTRRAVFEFLSNVRSFQLLYHVKDLTVLRNVMRPQHQSVKSG